MAEDYGVSLKITADTSDLDQIPQKVEATRKEIEQPVAQTVETVNEIHGIGDAHDPDDGNEYGQNGRQTQVCSRAGQHGVGDKLNAAAEANRDDGGKNLHDKLGQRLERVNIVQHAKHHDDERTDQNAHDLPINFGKQQHTDNEGDKNGR